MSSTLAFAVLCSVAATASAQTALPFDAKTWRLTGDAKIESYLGRAALRARRGMAFADGVAFRDGTIDLDMAVGVHRNFSYVFFRRQGEGEQEEIYLRTHKSELPDAVQYCPTWQGLEAWQLFHGTGFTAHATFPRDRWFPVRIVVSGDRAAIFVDGAARPQLIVPRLRRGAKAGGLAIGATLLDDDPAAWSSFSNVVLRPGEIPFDFAQSPAPPETEPPGVVRRWEVSEPLVPAEGPIRTIPASAAGWKTIAAEASGLLAADRWVKRDAKRPAVLARIEVESAADAVKELQLGYSDEVTVFLNGRPLFSGDARYSHDNPRQEGLIGPWQATVYLPLRRGRNEVVLAVADAFGGWGWMGQIADRTGLKITP